MKRNIICIMNIPEGEEKEKRTESVFKTIIAENFPSVERETPKSRSGGLTKRRRNKCCRNHDNQVHCKSRDSRWHFGSFLRFLEMSRGSHCFNDLPQVPLISMFFKDCFYYGQKYLIDVKSTL